MRNSSILKSRFFIAGTGRKLLTEHGHRVAYTALYLTACPHSHMSGVYYLSPGTAAYELCVTADQFLADVEILEAEGFARYDRAACVIWIVSMMRHQVSAAWKAGDTRVRTIMGHLEALPDSALIGEFRRAYGMLADAPSDGACRGASDTPPDGACHAPADAGPKPLPAPKPLAIRPPNADRGRAAAAAGVDAIAERFLGPVDGDRPRMAKIGGAL